MNDSRTAILEKLNAILRVSKATVLASDHRIPRSYLYAFREPRKYEGSTRLFMPAFVAIARIVGGGVTPDDVRAEYVARGGYRGKKRELRATTPERKRGAA